MLNLGSSFQSFYLFWSSLSEFHFIAFPSLPCFSFHSFSCSVKSMELSPYLLCPPCQAPCWLENHWWQKQRKSLLSWSLPLLGRQKVKDKLNRSSLSEKTKGRSKGKKKIKVWRMLSKFYTMRMTLSRMWLWNTDFLLVGYKGGEAGSSFPPAGRGLSLMGTVLSEDMAWFSRWGSQQSICLKPSPKSQQFSACKSSLSHLLSTELLKMGF